MKTIKVAAAIIQHNGKILATQRGYGEFKDGWEFPGGKLEPGENSVEALKREIKEELDTDIEVGDLLDTIEYDYPKFHLSMDCYLCTLKSNNIVLKEHEASKWLSIDDIDSINWLPADKCLIHKIKSKVQI
ncbi:hypothetical protein M9Y10_035577 [Tritrichomonas musculus]|uniref:8-oxo-dGTP diphosphatase n=1 Tax=Tritrichomonas musculus TaxID=1915356 RepID=A0ABR2GWY1_9EUKA